MILRSACAMLLSASAAALSLGAQVSQRDSAGVRIVVNKRSAATGSVLSLAAQPLCVVPAGGHDGELTSAPSAILLSRDRLMVANAAQHRLEFYTCAGKATFVGARGRVGKGPGEFTSIASVTRIRGDTLVVSQSYAAPVVVLNDSGGAVTTWPVRGNLACCFDDGTLLVGRAAPRRGASSGPAMAYYRFHPADLSEDAAPVLTVPQSQAAPSKTAVQRTATARVNAITFRPPPFGQLSSVRAAGSRIVVATGAAYVIDIHSLDGRLIQSVRVDEPGRPIGARERAEYVADQLSDLEGSQRDQRARELAGATFPDRMPPYRRVETDDAGCLWVERYPVSTKENGQWDVFSEAGRLLGTISTPPGGRLMSIRRRNVVLRSTDTDGLIELRVHPLAASDTTFSCRG